MLDLQLRSGYKKLLDGSKYEEDALLFYAKPEVLRNLREYSSRVSVEPGVYVIIPFTLKVGKEAKFLLRVYSETETEAE